MFYVNLVHMVCGELKVTVAVNQNMYLRHNVRT